jgi:Na+/phosphate symporter
MLFVMGRFAPDAMLSAGIQDRRVQVGTVLMGGVGALFFLGITLFRAVEAASIAA